MQPLSRKLSRSSRQKLKILRPARHSDHEWKSHRVSEELQRVMGQEKAHVYVNINLVTGNQRMMIDEGSHKLRVVCSAIDSVTVRIRDCRASLNYPGCG